MNYEQYQNYQSAYQALYQKTPRGKYAFHKSSAKKRGIPFLLTFEEWWDIWQASGKWEQRGRRRDQYVMARFGDLGAYKRDNVRICLAGENTDEMRQGLPPRGKRTPEEQKAANRGYAAKARRGRKIVDTARSEFAIGRRMVVRSGRRCWAHPNDADYPD